MRSSPWSTSVLLAGSLAWATACGGDSSTNAVTPAGLAITAGNLQSAQFGDTLPQPLVVSVTGSDGHAFAGATVTWGVAPAGAAAVSPATSTSAADGSASTVVVLGSTAGPVAVTATVAGVSPASFSVTSIEPCGFRRPYTVGQTVTAVLSTHDCTLSNGSHIDYYGVTNTTAQWLRFTESSSAFDALLSLRDAPGLPLAVSDDENSTTHNSAFRVVLAPGSFVLGANSFLGGETGSYTIGSAPADSNLTNCESVFLTRGVQTSQRIQTTDCTAGSYLDNWPLLLVVGQTVTIDMTSDSVDAYLELVQVDISSGNQIPILVAFDDDGGGGSNAKITYTPDQTTEYVVAAETFSAGETGPYVLSVSAAPPALAVASGPAFSARDLVIAARTMSRPLHEWATVTGAHGLRRADTKH